MSRQDMTTEEREEYDEMISEAEDMEESADSFRAQADDLEADADELRTKASALIGRAEDRAKPLLLGNFDKAIADERDHLPLKVIEQGLAELSSTSPAIGASKT